MEQGRLNGRRGSHENRGNASIEEEEKDEKNGWEQGFETPESESKEGRIHNKPTKQRKESEDEVETPEAKEEEEEEGLIFLPLSLELENLRDWAVPGSEGDKGALVDVNNRKVLSILNPLV